MAFEMNWGTYADWLICVEGMDTLDAIRKISTLYKRQTGKVFEEAQAEQLRDYIEERF